MGKSILYSAHLIHAYSGIVRALVRRTLACLAACLLSSRPHEAVVDGLVRQQSGHRGDVYSFRSGMLPEPPGSRGFVVSIRTPLCRCILRRLPVVPSSRLVAVVAVAVAVRLIGRGAMVSVMPVLCRNRLIRKYSRSI